MKSHVKKLLQQTLGFDNYLFLFSRYIINTLKWNKKEGDFLHFLNLVEDDGIVLDIGANVGVMTVYLAKKLRNSTVHAFEPIPNNLKALQRIVSFYHLKNVVIHDFALGAESGNLEMVLPVVGNVKMQGLSHIVHDSIQEFNDGEIFNVEVKILDEMPELEREGSRIKAIKMDVENFEYFVLKGGEKLIQKNAPLIYTELWENENREKCLTFIRAQGYSVNVLNSGQLELFNPEKHHTQNFFFLPPN